MGLTTWIKTWRREFLSLFCLVHSLFFTIHTVRIVITLPLACIIECSDCEKLRCSDCETANEFEKVDEKYREREKDLYGEFIKAECKRVQLKSPDWFEPQLSGSNGLFDFSNNDKTEECTLHRVQ